jgi:hypothetical protein
MVVVISLPNLTAGEALSHPLSSSVFRLPQRQLSKAAEVRGLRRRLRPRSRLDLSQAFETKLAEIRDGKWQCGKCRHVNTEEWPPLCGSQGMSVDVA